jgi:hypothetical protein
MLSQTTHARCDINYTLGIYFVLLCHASECKKPGIEAAFHQSSLLRHHRVRARVSTSIEATKRQFLCVCSKRYTSTAPVLFSSIEYLSPVTATQYQESTAHQTLSEHTEKQKYNTYTYT